MRPFCQGGEGLLDRGLVFPKVDAMRQGGSPSRPVLRFFREGSMDLATQGLGLVYLVIQFTLIGAGLLPVFVLFTLWMPQGRGVLSWTAFVLAEVLVFNYAYLVALLLLRIVVPRPKEGYFPRGKDGQPPKEGVLLMLNACLSVARYGTPWAAMISSVLVNIFPLHWFYVRLFGPHTPTRMLWDMCYFVDPYLVTAGKNLQVGFRSTVVCHLFDQRGLLIKRVWIGDNVVIGGESTVMPGARIGNGALIGARSLVLPDAVIGPGEIWAGIPARKVGECHSDSTAGQQHGWGEGPGQAKPLESVPPKGSG